MLYWQGLIRSDICFIQQNAGWTCTGSLHISDNQQTSLHYHQDFATLSSIFCYFIIKTWLQPLLCADQQSQFTRVLTQQPKRECIAITGSWNIRWHGKINNFDAWDCFSSMMVRDCYSCKKQTKLNWTIHAIVQDPQVCEAYHHVCVTVIRTLLPWS